MVPVPTIPELIQDPAKVRGLPTSTLATLLTQCKTAEGIVTAELILAAGRVAGPRRAQVDGHDRMLTVEEAAAILRSNRRWFYDHADQHDWIKRVSRKKMLCSETGLRRWMATRT